jgi:DNA-binding IclR family transcriptional regulator
MTSESENKYNQILQFLQQAKCRCSVKKLSENLSMKRGEIVPILYDLIEKGDIKREWDGISKKAWYFSSDIT